MKRTLNIYIIYITPLVPFTLTKSSTYVLYKQPEPYLIYLYQYSCKLIIFLVTTYNAIFDIALYALERTILFLFLDRNLQKIVYFWFNHCVTCSTEHEILIYMFNRALLGNLFTLLNLFIKQLCSNGCSRRIIRELCRRTCKRLWIVIKTFSTVTLLNWTHPARTLGEAEIKSDNA